MDASQCFARWALFGALFTLGCGAGPMPPSAKSPLVGRELPAIGSRTIDGEQLGPERFEGKVVVVKFFAEYCAPCRLTLPAAQKLAAERPDVLVIGVAEDEKESVVRETMATYGLTFPVIHDRGQVLAGKFRVSELPATFVAGRDRTVRWVGATEESQVDLEAVLDGLAP